MYNDFIFWFVISLHNCQLPAANFWRRTSDGTIISSSFLKYCKQWRYAKKWLHTETWSLANFWAYSQSCRLDLKTDWVETAQVAWLPFPLSSFLVFKQFNVAISLLLWICLCALILWGCRNNIQHFTTALRFESASKNTVALNSLIYMTAMEIIWLIT